MPGSFEAGGLKGQHSKRRNPNTVVNDCFTFSVVRGLAAGEREELTENMQFPALSPFSSNLSPPNTSQLWWSGKQEVAAGTWPTTRQGFHPARRCRAQGTSPARTASKAA